MTFDNKKESVNIQNATAYLAGFGAITMPLQEYARNPTKENEDEASYFFSRKGIISQYLEGANDRNKINPGNYELDTYYMQLPDRKKSS